jgi:hypothetical protein
VYHILTRRFKPQLDAEHVGECVCDTFFDICKGWRDSQQPFQRCHASVSDAAGNNLAEVGQVGRHI